MYVYANISREELSREVMKGSKGEKHCNVS
jgi:hypothetical protein